MQNRRMKSDVPAKTSGATATTFPPSPGRRRIIIRKDESRSQAPNLSVAELRYKELLARVVRSASRGSRGKLRLLSRASERLDVFAECTRCRTLWKPLWFYSKSTWGPLMLCSGCKARLSTAQSKKPDAMDHAELGGAFEMNRRRH